ncbi:MULTISPECIES: universal stress protein [unclassified Leeuwenhoekiella]|uniref:universal stress protein n=1 Tax=unclassified Leeuwenhoekiella TaxID=2615029 RepID=UPI000C6A63C0|nr:MULTISPECIES: universal stress protein [unclassified Leeuwenhoekiella]MAW95929.1 universal stress protein UspA [Leeuwenhoekiella sp.]MBA79923.1 universal stress protein UspA [Leeuwenhoekiella sp.]|tara:strand:+ start:21128 stop:21928 length:801 start_codon:yes stop_codon:yes gene_type:complete
MKTIFLPLGEKSAVSKTNVTYILELARVLKATLYVSKLYKEPGRSGGLPPKSLKMAQIAEQEISEMLSGFNTEGVKIRVKPLEGDDWVEAVGKFHQKTNLDLIVLTPKSHNVNEANFLGKTAGGLLRNTETAVLVVPADFEYKPISRILMVVKSGIVNNRSTLDPLHSIKKRYKADLRLLQIKTPDYLPEDSEFDANLGELVNTYKYSENATVFQGLLEHLNENKPDLICVFKRKRGFFEKLWEDDSVKKADFESRIPLLVLKEKQ